MKRVVLLTLFSFFILFSTAAFSQIYMDGDSTDWQNEPVLIEWVDNVDGLYPPEVGAAVADIVDVKEVKAKMVGNVLYYFIRMWDGPAWPNEVYEREHEGTIYMTSRGYYHILVDLDNDATTGWNTAWYEAHYTPVGYLESQSIEGADPIGAELMMEWGSRYRDQYEIDEGSAPVKDMDYWAADYSEYNGQNDTGSEYEIFNIPVINADSARGMSWEGSSMINSTDDAVLENDPRSFWVGHGWGDDFIEVGIEVTAVKEYFKRKGFDYFKSGDVIAFCGHVETPMDDWANDITTRGELTLPEIPNRPSAFTFDGDSTDWQDIPTQINWVDNVDGLYPPEVGAAVADHVDVKDVKVKIDADALYYLIRMWDGPVWPNEVYEREHEGTIYMTSRGYYHLLLDVDNDATTGWNTAWYEAHYTPVGYLESQSVEGADPIGAEFMMEWGARYNDEWAIADGSDPVRNLDYWVADYSEYNGQNDTGSEYEVGNFEITEKDSALGMKHDGLLLNNSSDFEDLLFDGQPDWMAHGWGDDFIEVGLSLRTVKKYWKDKTGEDIFQVDDVIAFCGHVETPMDDWANDITTRGETSVLTAISVKNPVAIVDEFDLKNNYPNPFNPETIIEYHVTKTADVSLVVYNTLGQKVRTLVNQSVITGKHTVTWNGTSDSGNSVPSGIYFYQLTSGANSITKRMILLK